MFGTSLLKPKLNKTPSNLALERAIKAYSEVKWLEYLEATYPASNMSLESMNGWQELKFKARKRFLDLGEEWLELAILERKS